MPSQTVNMPPMTVWRAVSERMVSSVPFPIPEAVPVQTADRSAPEWVFSEWFTRKTTAMGIGFISQRDVMNILFDRAFADHHPMGNDVMLAWKAFREGQKFERQINGVSGL